MTSYPISAIAIGGAAAYLIATLSANRIAKAGFPLPLAERRIGHIDGLRGYLAISVILHHFIIWMQVTRLGGSWTQPSINLFQQLGAGAVALFFMTTGLLFYPHVLTGLRAGSWPAIYTKRLFRILPMSLFSVAVVTVIICLRTGRAFDTNFPLAALKWLTAWDEPPLLDYPDSGRLNAYVLWSLWYEWQFYLFVLPACALTMDLIRGRLPSWVLPVTLIAGAFTAQTLQNQSGMLILLPLFATGMLAFECQSREEIASALRSPTASIMAGLSLAIGINAFSWPYTVALPFFGFFFICVACGNDMGGSLRTKGALVLGECSYSIYLLHGVVLNVVFVDGAALIAPIPTAWLPALLPIITIVVMLVTPLTYLWVERPAVRAGSQLARACAKARLHIMARRRIDSPEHEVAP
jgi:peptidoglycan/LPS O-acetylase OafA/YrhL